MRTNSAVLCTVDFSDRASRPEAKMAEKLLLQRSSDIVNGPASLCCPCVDPDAPPVSVCLSVSLSLIQQTEAHSHLNNITKITIKKVI